MKKFLLILCILLGTVLIALFILPRFFKNDILRLIENQTSRHLNAQVNIGDMTLSMFKSFPHLNVTLEDAFVTGKGEFEQDTLLIIPHFEASVNVKSLLSGEEVIVNKILLQNTRLYPTVSTAGNANWNIFLSQDSLSTSQEEDPAAAKTSSGTNKNLQLNDIYIEKLYLGYNDYHTSTYASIGALNFHLSGNLSASHTAFKTNLALQDISFRQQNSVWVNHTDLNWEAVIDANFEDLVFHIQENSLQVNDLKLDLTGGIAVQGEKYDVHLKLNAPDTKFESLLALVPKALQSHIQGLKTTGDFDFIVTADGELYPGHLPALNAVFTIHDASIQYPQLPEAIRKINVDLRVSNPGGPIDSTLIDLKKLAFDIASNPFCMSLQIANPQDPLLNGSATGVINFANLKKALPLQDISLEGILTTDITLHGKYQYIEKEQYEKFTAKGSIVLKDVLFKNAEFPEGIIIPEGSVVITPARLNLNKLQARIYSSDFTLQGYLENYLPYFFKSEILRGNFALTSHRLNLNEFIRNRTSVQDTSTAVPDTLVPGSSNATQGALEVPKNINLQLATNVETLLFDRLVIRQLKGKVSLAESVATLENLSMNMLKGTMVMNGKYSTVNPRTPTVNFGLNISDFDIHDVYQSFTFIRKSIPIAMNCNGQISSAMKFAATLDKEMSPILNTINGDGYLDSKGILINDNPAMNQLANVLNNDELSRLSISNLRINFKIEDGNIIVAPFQTTLAGNPVTIYGSQSVDGKLNYTLSMNVNRKFFGKEINNLLGAIPGTNNIQNLEIEAKVGGTLAKPELKADLSKAVDAVKKEAGKELKNKALKGLEKLFR